VRNVFDQYRHPENRLTHALLSCLYESPKLLDSFATLVGHPAPKRAGIAVRQQYRPGEVETPEDEAERKGLPDGWLDDGEHWALVIESKVLHRISLEQLRAHRRAARGFDQAKVVLVSLESPPLEVRKEFLCLRWTDVYQWASKSSRSDPWAEKLAKYMEVAERKLIEQENELTGALTVFSGIPFEPESPYSYPEAKRLLRLLMEDLRGRQELAEKLGVDLKRDGRAAITGKAGFSVWDMLPLAAAGEHFTDAPHLTVGIRHDEAIAQLTIPNNVSHPTRKTLLGGTFEGFEEVLARFVKAIGPVLKKDPDAKPYIEVMQRHWPHRRAQAVKDAELVFDPRTWSGDGAVKEQQEWARVAFDAMWNKNSNLQMAIGVRFPYGVSEAVSRPDFADVVASVFLATQPILSSL
jgi:hypothetical protein